MSKISFANLDKTLDFTNDLVSFTGSKSDGETPFAYSWISPTGHDVTLIGNGFEYEGQGATGGTVTQLSLDLFNDSVNGSPDLVFKNASIPLSQLHELSTGSLTGAKENDLFWKTVLKGNDQIDFGSNTSEGGLAIYFAGDGRIINGAEILKGSSDDLTGDIGFGYVAGDAFVVANGSKAYGGSDTMDIDGYNSAFAVGDVMIAQGKVVGGKDVITARGQTSIVGDVHYVEVTGTVTGGGDKATVLGDGYATGDAHTVDGELFGGDDVLNGGKDSNLFWGDVFELRVTGSLVGGDDVIHGGGGADTIHGDYGLSKGKVVGGNDKLYGDSGVDTIYGNEGDDLLDGGKDDDSLAGGLGTDILIGGKGHDSFVFDTKLDPKNVDTIDDFSHTDDRILLDEDFFAKAGQVLQNDQDGHVKLSKGAFWASDSGKAHDGTDRVIYDKTDGHLYYDADGTGSKKAVLFADLDAHLKIDASDFILVA